MEKNYKRNEQGELVLETTITMIAAMLVVFFIMNLTFIIYNKQVVASTAIRTANDVANVYRNPVIDPFYGFKDDDDFENNHAYRYLPIAAGNLATKNEDKAKWYAAYYLKKTSIGQLPTDLYGGIEVETGRNSLKQRTIQVKIVEEYSTFALNPLIAVGVDPKYKAAAVASAVCYDPIHDMNVSKFYDEIYDVFEKSNRVTLLASNVLKVINKIISLF